MMKMKLAFFLCGAIAAFAVRGDLAEFVDPFIGTAGTGHTFPGACVPFGLIQAGPDTGTGDWDHCSGYVYGDTNLYGFSQTHLNGTGCGELGDIRLLPFTSEDVPEFLPLDKATEKASPGYYTVTAGGVKTEVTATKRVASYKFTFPKGAKRRLLVDTQWGVGSWGAPSNHVLSADVVVTNNAIEGSLHVRQWNVRRVSFVVQPDLCSSLAVRSVTELKRRPGETAPRFVFDFTDGDAPVFVDVALSANSVGAACANLLSEHSCISQAPNPTFFDCLVRKARARWNDLLARATVEGTDGQKRNWYTSLYHLCVQPNDIADVNDFASGRHQPFYSTFSTWDTFRAAGPLYTILVPDRAAEFVDSMLKQGKITGYLPIWTLWGSDNQCMIGTHSIPMIVDAYLKGVWTGDAEAAYAQVKDTLTRTHKGRFFEDWELYDRGYYPYDKIDIQSVSRTLECAYDDWCAAVLAEKLGKSEDAAFFRRRSANWRNVFDPVTGFARGRDSKGAWRDPFNPFVLTGLGAEGRDYTEGNAIQYTWHVMQDPDGLVAAMGGRSNFIDRLDRLFTMPSAGEGQGTVADVSGFIGQYVQGNEPSHHVIYFYSLVGCPEKTAERVREVFDRFYLPKPDGLCGNDDCGQMSAWYLFGAMGFYPFNPCGGDYVLGAPQVPRVELTVGGEKRRKFTVVAKGLSEENKYVKSITLNGKPFKGPILKHADIVAGGELVFEMSASAER